MVELDLGQIQCIYDEILSIKASLKHYSSEKWITEEEFWNRYNSKVKKLEELTGADLNEYLVEVKYKPDKSSGSYFDLRYSGNYVETSVFNLQIGRLRAWLEHNYISKAHIKSMRGQSDDKISPIVFNQHLNQSQNVSIQISIKEFEGVIDANRKKYAEDSKEAKFLDRVKTGLKNVKNIKDIILLVYSIAKASGLSIDDIKRIIG